MTNKQVKIRQYVYGATNGLVCLSRIHLEQIIKIVEDVQDDCSALLYKKDYMTGNWQLMRTVKVSQREIDKVLDTNKGMHLAGFYRWDIYGSDENLLRQIFSVNSFLF